MFRFRKQPESVETRVTRGMDTLDRANPGWHRNINPYRLNIARADACALGQTYGSYREGLDTLNMGHSEAVKNGFQASRTIIAPDSIREEFEALTLEWDRQIKARRYVEDETERAEALIAAQQKRRVFHRV